MDIDESKIQAVPPDCIDSNSGMTLMQTNGFFMFWSFWVDHLWISCLRFFCVCQKETLCTRSRNWCFTCRSFKDTETFFVPNPETNNVDKIVIILMMYLVSIITPAQTSEQTQKSMNQNQHVIWPEQVYNYLLLFLREKAIKERVQVKSIKGKIT